MQLRQHIDKLDSLNAHVVVISFGTFPGAIKWLEETGAPFEVLLDPERDAYAAYGLERSFIRSWGARVWLSYARLLLTGRRWRGIQGNSAQLGGDFIVDSNGIIRFAYRSHDPTAPPQPREIMDALRHIRAKNQTLTIGNPG